MKHTSGFTLLLVIAVFQTLVPLYGINPNDQPHMRNAIGHLEAAKTAEKPLVSLRAAHKALVNAKANKEGERKDAIALVNEAIAFATTGDTKTMLVKIDKAIANVKSGVARSR